MGRQAGPQRSRQSPTFYGHGWAKVALPGGEIPRIAASKAMRADLLRLPNNSVTVMRRTTGFDPMKEGQAGPLLARVTPRVYGSRLLIRVIEDRARRRTSMTAC